MSPTNPAEHTGPFVELEATWVGAAIPVRKLRNVRSTHAMPEDEAVLVVYDDTLFGGATDGLVLTDRRLCFKQTFESPRSIPYSSITTVDRLGSSVRVAGIEVDFQAGWTVAHAERLLAFLQAVARPSDTLSFADRVLIATREHLGTADHVYFAPAIPIAKEQNVRRVHGMPDRERILALFDDTLFGSARDHWVFTDRRFGWKQLFDDPGHLPWSELAHASRSALDDQFILGPVVFDVKTSRHALGPVFDELAAHIAEPLDPELAARIDADPDDDEPRLVLLDWLLEQGHARGTLGALQSDADGFLAQLASHDLELGGPRGDVFTCSWRHGYWDRLVLLPNGSLPTRGDPEDLFARILGHPSARFVRSITLGPPGAPVTDRFVLVALKKVLLRVELPCLEALEQLHYWKELLEEATARFPRLRQR